MKEQLHLLKTSVQKSTEKAEKKAIEQKLLVSAFIFLFSTKLYYQSNEMISIYDLNLKMNFCKVMQDLVCYTNGLKLFISLSRNSKGKKKNHQSSDLMGGVSDIFMWNKTKIVLVLQSCFWQCYSHQGIILTLIHF